MKNTPWVAIPGPYGTNSVGRLKNGKVEYSAHSYHNIEDAMLSAQRLNDEPYRKAIEAVERRREARDANG